MTIPRKRTGVRCLLQPSPRSARCRRRLLPPPPPPPPHILTQVPCSLHLLPLLVSLPRQAWSGPPPTPVPPVVPVVPVTLSPAAAGAAGAAAPSPPPPPPPPLPPPTQETCRRHHHRFD